MRKKIVGKSVKRMTVFALALVFVFSGGFIGPVNSKASAAQDNEKKLPEKYVQGYKVDKDGKKTPVYNTDNTSKGKAAPKADEPTSPYAANYPKLSEDPYAPAPGSGTTTTESADVDIIYFKGTISKSPTENDSKEEGPAYLQKLPDGKIELGTYNPETLELSPATDINNERETIGEEEMVKKYGPQYAWSKAFDGTTKLKRETKFNLLSTSTVDNSAEWWSGLDIKHGVSTSESYKFAMTVGFKVSTGVPGIGTAEMSTELTNEFGTDITISDEVTYKDQTKVPAATNPDYKTKYPVYRGALYQLSSTYTLEPGTGLQELMKAGGWNDFIDGLANQQYKYNDKELYYPVTPGSHQ